MIFKVVVNVHDRKHGLFTQELFLSTASWDKRQSRTGLFGSFLSLSRQFLRLRQPSQSLIPPEQQPVARYCRPEGLDTSSQHPAEVPFRLALRLVILMFGHLGECPPRHSVLSHRECPGEAAMSFLGRRIATFDIPGPHK